MKWGHQVPQNSLLLRDAESKVKKLLFLLISSFFQTYLTMP